MPPYKDSYQKALVGAIDCHEFDIKYGQVRQCLSLVDVSLIFNFLKYFRVDVIHLHWQHPFLLDSSKTGTVIKSASFITQMLLLKILRTKTVWTVHNMTNHEEDHKVLELFFSGMIARLSNKIIAHCEVSKRQIIKEFGVRENKVVVIPHGNFISNYENKIKRHTAREKFNFSDSDFVFLYFGLIRPYKGVVELIDAFEKIENGSTKLLIAGKVPDKKLAREIHQKTVGNCNISPILEFIKDDDVQLYMNSADVLVLPYKSILNSGGIFMGLTFGKAMITPRLGCIPEILDEEGNFLYDPGDDNSLVTAMLEAASSRDKLSLMGSHNLELARKYDWKAIGARTSDLYKSLKE